MSHQDDVLEILLRGVPDQEATAAKAAAQEMREQMSDAIDIIRGILADREGRDALAKAIRKGAVNG